jgi:2-polyprenylphenol 6-hydroxylase
MQQLQTDFLIVGAGPVGMSLFLELSRLNKKVVLVDRSSFHGAYSGDQADVQEWDARNYALSPANIAWLKERLGASLSAALSEHGTPMRAMHVVYEAGKAFFELSSSQVKQPYLAWMIRHDRLCSLLEAKVWDQPLARSLDTYSGQDQVILSPVQLTKMEWSSEHVSVYGEQDASSFVIHAKLAIGADGAQSWVREQAGVAVQRKSYTHEALVGCFETERPHAGMAYQWFKKNGDIMAWLPMPNGVGVVWSHTPDLAQRESFFQNPQKLADELSLYGCHRLGRWRYQGGLATFPLVVHSVQEGLLPSPRLLLMGDAKHRMHPLAGQGLNLGLLELRQLTEVLRRFPLTDPGHPWLHSALRAQETWVQKALPWGVDKIWQANQPSVLPHVVQESLGLGWRSFHQLGLLKRLFFHAVSV